MTVYSGIEFEKLVGWIRQQYSYTMYFDLSRKKVSEKLPLHGQMTKRTPELAHDVVVENCFVVVRKQGLTPELSHHALDSGMKRFGPQQYLTFTNHPACSSRSN